MGRLVDWTARWGVAFVAVAVVAWEPSASALVVRGTPQADELVGTWHADVIIAGDGDDNVHSYRGADEVRGQGGADVIRLGRSAPWTPGHSTYDVAYGGPGNDRIFGGRGKDMVFGGPGADVLIGESGFDELDGGHGDDRLWGGSNYDSLTPGSGEDRVEGGTSDDVVYLFDDGSPDFIDCGSGYDVVEFEFASDPLDTFVHCEEFTAEW